MVPKYILNYINNLTKLTTTLDRRRNIPKALALTVMLILSVIAPSKKINNKKIAVNEINKTTKNIAIAAKKQIITTRIIKGDITIINGDVIVKTIRENAAIIKPNTKNV